MLTAAVEQAYFCERRRPTNWAALEALQSLNPPSPTPSLSTCALSSLCSSGEIPIYLDTGLDSILSDFSGSGSTEQHHPTSPTSSDGTGTEGTCTAATSAQPVPRNVPFSPSISSLKAAIHRSPNEPTLLALPNGSYSDRLQTDTSIEYYLTISAHESSPDQALATPTGSAWPSPVASPRTSVCSTTTSPMGSPCSPNRFLGSGSLYGCLSPVSTDNVFGSGASLGPYYRSSSYSTLSTSLFGSGTFSPSPSSATMDADRSLGFIRDRSFSKRLPKSSSCSPLAEGRLRSQVPDVKEAYSAPVTPTFPHFDSLLTRTDSSGTMASVRSVGSARSSRISSPLASPSSKAPNLPGLLGWLRDVSLDLWIDQDSTRSICSRFKLMGYTSEPSENRDLELINALTYGTADFCPVERRSFVIRRGNIDSPPVLRRLTVAGDDSKDYISRHASLTVQSNGMYFVNGTELFPRQSPFGYSQSQQRREPLKLQWRFEYLVQDHGDGGMTITGDKTFTPLSFSCSPGLLHPTHGKKTKLMQMMKKNLAAKLSAEKMHVPRPCVRLDLTAGRGNGCADGLRPAAAVPQSRGSVLGDGYTHPF